VLEAIAGVVTLALLGLSAAVGVRLVRRGRGDGGRPLLFLGLYFLLYSALATGLSVATYMGWSSVELVLPDLVARSLNAGFFLTSTLGLSFLLLFTQRTFRPHSPAARTTVWGGALLMGVAAAALGASEGFEVRVLPGPAYWVHFAARIACWVWVAWESFAFYAIQRRRLAIGLADPVVTNRFLLWGVWATVLSLLAFADPVARLWYFHLAGTTTQWIPEIGRPIIEATVPIACGLNVAAVVLMVLTFFPTAGYRRWLAAHPPHPIDAGPVN
jgi:hypothetical protein